MKVTLNHIWPETITEAKEIQEKLRSQVIREDRIDRVKYVAGVDVGFRENYTIAVGAIAVLDFTNLKTVEKATASRPTTFPYIPGYLSFREVPVILDALEKLTVTPDLILCDGQGIAHPKRIGLASHLGVLIDLPTIGAAKSLFIGRHQQLGENKGSWQPLVDREEIVGAVVRSRSGVKPIYVSIGHRISLASAIEYTLACTSKYRLPETTRIADRLSREA
ncbi:MAG: deoxyribonuclease V [Prochloraceae cyanobacterium]